MAPLVITALVSAVPASADCPPPQPDLPCPSGFSEVMTWPRGDKMPLVCQDGADGLRWRPVTVPFPPNDRWLSYGPEMTLHGQGRRNPNVLSGSWTATPQDEGTTCRAEQVSVVGPGQLGAPDVAEGAPGQPWSVDFGPTLFSVELSGHCLWDRQSG